MIPTIQQPQWGDLVKGKIDPQLKSFSFKMKVFSVRKFFEVGTLTLTDAIKDLHSHCSKHEQMYQADIDLIFKTKTSTL